MSSGVVRVICCEMHSDAWQVIQRTLSLPGVALSHLTHLSEGILAALAGEADVLVLPRIPHRGQFQKLAKLCLPPQGQMRMVVLTGWGEPEELSQGEKVFFVREGRRSADRLMEALLHAVAGEEVWEAGETAGSWWDREVTRPGIRFAPRLNVPPKLRVKVRYSVPGSRARHYADLLDISTTGFRAELPPNVTLATGTSVDFSVIWQDSSCSGKGNVVHILPTDPSPARQRVGVRIQDMDGMHASRLNHLIKLVETRGLAKNHSRKKPAAKQQQQSKPKAAATVSEQEEARPLEAFENE